MHEILKLSVSKTKCFLDCNKKYYFSYILKLPKKEFSYHIFGKFVHKVLEDFHLEYIKGSNEPYHKIMAIKYKEALSEYKDKISNDLKKEAYEIFDLYLKILSQKKKASNVLAVEKSFNFNISDTVILNGMIDRVQIDNDGILHVCDYKTTKNKKYLKNDFMQLLTYAYVLYNEDPNIEKIRGSYILLRHNFEYITKEFSKDEILKMKDTYQNYAKMIDEEKLWRPNTTALCAYCDFLDKCDQGKEFVNKSRNFKHGETAW